MRRHLALYTTAARYDLVEHSRNRFAMLLIVLYIPLWISLAYVAIPDRAAPLHLRSTGEHLAPAGNELTQITGAINAVTLITGFMMFAATFTGHRFDRRLAMSGYPRLHLIAAKATSLTLTSAFIALYAAAVTCLSWTPEQPLQLAAALFCAAMTYGAIGVVLGSVLRREVEGMFALIMISVIDVLLPNPMWSSGADSSLIRFLPSYGASQAATAAGFSTTRTPAHLAIELLWFTGAALLALLTFHRRTRNAHHKPHPSGATAMAPPPEDTDPRRGRDATDPAGRGA
jgi:hypothetical protein